jgi:hypothetical protein
MTERRERRLLLALFGLALLLRCGFSLVYGLGAPPARWGDDAEYDAIASHLVFGHHYQNNWFPPGYPFFLAMVYSLFGHSFAAVRLVQAVLGAASCCVVYLVGRDAFGRAVGWFAGLALAFWPGHIYMSWRLMSETLFTLLIACAVFTARPLLAAASTRREGAPSPDGARPVQHPIRLGAVLGLTLGASALVKSNLVLFAALAIGWLLVGGIFWRRRESIARNAALDAPIDRHAALGAPNDRHAALDVPVDHRWRQRWAPAAAALAAFLAMLLANPLANRLSLAAGGATGPVALTPGNAGPTLWWSNNPLADGYFVDPDDTAAGRSFIARHGLARAMRDPNPFVRDAAQRRLAFAWIRENPGDFGVLVLRKLWNAYGPTPHAAVLSQSSFAQVLQLITWSALLPAALAGIALSRRRWRAALPLYLVLAASVLTTVVFYGTPRFTLPVAPYLLVFAGYSLHAAALQLRGVRRARAAAGSSRARTGARYWDASAPTSEGASCSRAATSSSGVFPQPGSV